MHSESQHIRKPLQLSVIGKPLALASYLTRRVLARIEDVIQPGVVEVVNVQRIALVLEKYIWGSYSSCEGEVLLGLYAFSFIGCCWSAWRTY